MEIVGITVAFLFILFVLAIVMLFDSKSFANRNGVRVASSRQINISDINNEFSGATERGRSSIVNDSLIRNGVPLDITRVNFIKAKSNGCDLLRDRKVKDIRRMKRRQVFLSKQLNIKTERRIYLRYLRARKLKSRNFNLFYNHRNIF